MAHTLTTGMAAQVAAAALAPVLFVEIDTVAGNVYMWSGFGSISWNGQLWLGAGRFGGVAAIQETSQVQAVGTQFSLSGIPADLISAALSSLRRFMPAKMWLGVLYVSGAGSDVLQIPSGDDIQIPSGDDIEIPLGTVSGLVADPYLIFSGRVDSCKISATGTTATIAVTAESRLIDMKRNRERRYTDTDQQIDYPGDTGFGNVDVLQDATILWG